MYFIMQGPFEQSIQQFLFPYDAPLCSMIFPLGFSLTFCQKKTPTKKPQTFFGEIP